MVLTKQTQNSNPRLFIEVKDCATNKVITKSKNQGAAQTETFTIWNEISSLLAHIVRSRSTIVVDSGVEYLLDCYFSGQDGRNVVLY
jgi:hypothetical protein